MNNFSLSLSLRHMRMIAFDAHCLCTAPYASLFSCLRHSSVLVQAAQTASARLEPMRSVMYARGWHHGSACPCRGWSAIIFEATRARSIEHINLIMNRNE